MSSRANKIGSFLLARTRSKSIRQRYATGNQYEKRKTFNFTNGENRLHRRISMRQQEIGRHGLTNQMMEIGGFKHLSGDARRRPDFDLRFASSGPLDSGFEGAEDHEHKLVHRQDGVEFAWKKRGDLQLFQVGRKAQTIFNCYRCGYPISSKLMAIKCDNWDWRMCYHCYSKVTREGDRS